MPFPTRSLTYAIPVADSAAAVLLAPDGSRDGFVIHNTAGVIFVKLSKYAAATNFTYRLGPNTTLEHSGYNGWVTAIRQTGIGDVLITELI